MPVIMTPVPSQAAQGTVAAQVQAASAVTSLDGVPLLERLQTVVVRSGQAPTILWTVRDRAGNPVDLSGALITQTNPQTQVTTTFVPVELRIAETVAGIALGTVPGTVIDLANGVVQVLVDRLTLPGPGVFYAELAVTDGATPANTVFSNLFYLVVERGALSQLSGTGGPPTFPEVRLHLRDSSPAESRLLDAVLFDDAEVAASLVRPVMYWNEALPPVAPYTTQTFPFRFYWLEAAAANLLFIASEWYRKNTLQYAAGGTAVADMEGKAEACAQAAQRRWEAYEKWVRSKKIAINIELGFGSLGSPYQLRSFGAVNVY